MAKEIDISKLFGQSSTDRIREYAAKIPIGKAVRFTDAVEELEMSDHVVVKAAEKAGVIFVAADPDFGGKRRMIANPKTVKQWHDAQSKLLPPKR